MIKISNSLTKTKEEFKPLKEKVVKMYACGVTVYDDCHIGHARSLYTFEVIRRYLAYRGYKVEFVRNITDVDDKIINKARDVAKDEEISLEEAFDKVRTTYIDSYYEDLELLDIPRADFEPKATENIKEMQSYIKTLIDKGFAYEKEGNVYFSVRKFKDFGKLSGKKIDDLISSGRIDSDPLKDDVLDFALWKAAKEDEPYWNSPWGKGRPGWHIECSVMSQKYLKVDTLDIHGGGRDLIFPHHENELTQAESLTGKLFAKYWMHHGLLTINKEKMAKSLGNFFTVKDVLKKYPPDVLKMLYLGAHYSSPVDFSWDKMEEAKSAYERILILYEKLNKYFENKKIPKELKASSGSAVQKGKFLDEEFLEAMDDDFNTPKGLAVLFDAVGMANGILISDTKKEDEYLAYCKRVIENICDLFGLTLRAQGKQELSDKEIESLINERNECKKNKDYARADQIRKELDEKGVILEDTKDGTTYRRKI